MFIHCSFVPSISKKTTIDFRNSPLITYLVPPSLDHAPDSSLQDCHLRGDIGRVAGGRGGEGGQEGQTHVFLLVGVGGRHPGTKIGKPCVSIINGRGFLIVLFLAR